MSDASVLYRVDHVTRCLTCRARCSKCQPIRGIQRYVGRWDADFDKAARFVMSPPIRGAGTAAKLRGGLAGGPLSIVATDHAVFNSTQKRAGRHDFRFTETVFCSSLLYHLAPSLLLEGNQLC